MLSHNSLALYPEDKKSLAEVQTIGDMKRLVEDLATLGNATLLGDTPVKEKLIAAAKIVGKVVSGVAGAQKLVILDNLML